MSFQVGGQILKMLKEEGDSVKKGELIAVLDDKDYRSNLQKAAAEVSKTLALSKDAASKYERQLPLCADNIVSPQDCETLLNNKDKAKGDYEAALAQKTFSQNQLDYTKFMHPKKELLPYVFRNREQQLLKDKQYIQFPKQNLSGLEHT